MEMDMDLNMHIDVNMAWDLDEATWAQNMIVEMGRY